MAAICSRWGEIREGHADWAHHITLDGLRVRGHGNNQQTVGIKTELRSLGLGDS